MWKVSLQKYIYIFRGLDSVGANKSTSLSQIPSLRRSVCSRPPALYCALTALDFAHSVSLLVRSHYVELDESVESRALTFCIGRHVNTSHSHPPTPFSRSRLLNLLFAGPIHLAFFSPLSLCVFPLPTQRQECFYELPSCGLSRIYLSHVAAGAEGGAACTQTTVALCAGSNKEANTRMNILMR